MHSNEAVHPRSVHDWGLMDRHRRMVRTIVCLVAAMSATSALLGWMDPSPAVPLRPLTIETALHEARSIVAESPWIAGEPWERIEVLAGASSEAVPAFLTATASRDRHHFRVELDGRLSSTTNRHRCEPATDDACAVRVEIARPEERQVMSRAQWNSLRALITALYEAANRANPACPVTFDETWAKLYGLEPGATINVTPIDKTPV